MSYSKPKAYTQPLHLTRPFGIETGSNIYSTFTMFSQTVNRYTAGMVYEQAYSLDFNWQKHLPEEAFKYHELLWKETNAPIDLHIGVVLPFVASCLGRKTRGHFLTRPSILNLFWINVVATASAKVLHSKSSFHSP